MTRDNPQTKADIMVEVWSMAALVVLALMGGGLSGALALIIGGAGGLRLIAARMETLESRQDTLADAVMREQKATAGRAGVAARKAIASGDSLTDAQARAAAEAVLAGETVERSVSVHSGLRKRPSVARIPFE